LGAFVASFLILSVRNGIYEGLSVAEAFANNLNMMLRRTLASGDNSAGLGANFSMEPPERTLNSLDAPITEVLHVYLTQNIFTDIPFWVFASLCVSLGVLLLASRQVFPSIAARRQEFVALYCTFLIAICAPLTWYVLAKAHAYIHTFWAMVAWYVPTMFFAALFALVILRAVIIDLAGHLRTVSAANLIRNANAHLAALIIGVIAILTWVIFSFSQTQFEQRTADALSQGKKYSLAKGWEAVIHENWIYIIANRCPFISQQTSILLKVSGSTNDGRAATQNLDFRWERQALKVPKRNDRDNRCVSRRLLPDATIRSISIAEQSPIYGILWTAEIQM